jgi:hypothetical protein
VKVLKIILLTKKISVKNKIKNNNDDSKAPESFSLCEFDDFLIPL